MSDIINYITSNWAVIGQVVGAVLALASVVTGLTATPVDDGIVNFLRSALGRLSALTYSDAPGSVKVPLVQSAENPLMVKRASRK